MFLNNNKFRVMSSLLIGFHVPVFIQCNESNCSPNNNGMIMMNDDGCLVRNKFFYIKYISSIVIIIDSLLYVGMGIRAGHEGRPTGPSPSAQTKCEEK